MPKEFATYILQALAYSAESWERTGRAWEDGEQEVLAELEYCSSAAEAWAAARFARSIERDVKEQIENSTIASGDGKVEGRGG